MQQKRLIISALSGGSGKTLSALGLCRALVNRGHTVLPFKKGPDYIDATWLSLASKKDCYNLDPFFMGKEDLQQHFQNICMRNPESIALIEGNRGLYDGKDVYGSASTAELAVTLDTPVVLTIDAKKTTRTLAALVNGMVNFDKRVSFIGLIFNNIASSRHEKIIYESVNHYCDVPILGFIPRLSGNPLPERHLGLELDPTTPKNEELLENIGRILTESININGLLTNISNLNDLKTFFSENTLAKKEQTEEITSKTLNKKIKIGYILDKAIWFYYTENIEALTNKDNVELIPLSLFNTDNWDSIDGLYIGGGYPEVFAKEISESKVLDIIKKKAENNFPIYAECGGFMLLTNSINNGEEKFPMSGIFSIDLEFYKKPQGLGYIEAEVVKENPFFSLGAKIKAHEFHYSLALTPPDESIYKLTKGTGMGNKVDGVNYKNVFASYTHIYAPTTPEWAENFVKLIRKNYIREHYEQ